MLGIAKTEIVRAFKTISIRNGNCFENSKLSLPKWLHYSYLLSIQTGPNDKTITNAFAGLREIEKTAYSDWRTGSYFTY